jgi:hypothetical protein
MFRIIYSLVVFIACFAPATYAVAADSAIPSRDSKLYGKHLVSEFDLNVEKSDKEWIGNEILATPEGSPYTIVVTLSATANSAGDATSLFAVGWLGIPNTAWDKPLSGLNKFGAKANERFSVTAASLPLSFKSKVQLTPRLSIMRQDNMTVSAIHVQVWSGIVDPYFSRIFSTLPFLALVVFAFLVRWVYFKKR